METDFACISVIPYDSMMTAFPDWAEFKVLHALRTKLKISLPDGPIIAGASSVRKVYKTRANDDKVHVGQRFNLQGYSYR